jgi:hypothetical protein
MKPVKGLFENAAAKITLVCLGLFLAAQNWAAAQGFEVDVNTGGGGSGGGAWYTSWWVWAAAALFILALVAIVSAGRRHS